MPAWIDTDAEEAAWRKATRIVKKQRKKNKSEFTDKDWGLVTHIAKGILRSSHSLSGAVPLDENTVFALANVERILDSRRKKDRKGRDALLSASDRSLVEALSQVAALGGQTIATLRDNRASKLSASETSDLTSELESVASRLRDVLLKVKG